VKIFCGEFGVYIPNSPHPDRVYWYDVVRKYLEEKGIGWIIWDYQGGFGSLKKEPTSCSIMIWISKYLKA
jgi:endoglucanase